MCMMSTVEALESGGYLCEMGVMVRVYVYVCGNGVLSVGEG